jgi:MFS family permease
VEQVRPRSLVLLVALAAGVAQAFGRFSYALLLPAINRDLLGSYALAGLVGTANVAAYLLGTVAVSGLARRAAPAALIRGGLLATCLGLFVLWQADGAVMLAVGLGLTGVGGAFIWVPAPGLAGSVVRASRRGAAIGVSGSGIGGGIVLASALTAVMQSRGGDASWRTVYLVEALLAVFVLVLCQRFLRPAVHKDDAAPVRSGALRRVPGWAGVVGGYAAYGLAYSIYTTYLVSALQDDGFSAGHAAGVYTLVGLALVGGGVLLGPASDRWGRGRTLVAGYAVMAAAILLVPVGSEPAASVSAIAFGLTMSGLPAVIAAHLADVLTPREFAGAFGRCTLAFGVAQLCGPPLGGLLAESTGTFTVPFVLAAAVAALGAALSVSVVRAPGLPRRT